MPRRTRPASRPPPRRTRPSTALSPQLNAKPSSKKATTEKSQKPPETTRKANEVIQNSPDLSSEDDSEEQDEDLEGESQSSSSEDEAENDMEDADAPRAVQWVDDEWEDMPGPSKPRKEIQDGKYTLYQCFVLNIQLALDISSLSMGSLRTAQHALVQAETISDSKDDSDDGQVESTSKAMASKEWFDRERPKAAPRPNKHAPMEMTSKRPVTRRRTVVEVKTVQPRDPRFIPLSGELSEEKYRHNYAFLTQAHKTELKILRENLKRARKLLVSSPKHLRSERESEVEKLELAVKRAESAVNKDKREEVERGALDKLKKEEKEKQGQGKGSWWMKEADKKKVLTRARYDALAQSGGERAVKKAIEKKQKKIGQKEKKSRPFGKRSAPSEGAGRPNKRPRIG
ncbi:related to rRNA biogenesis protein RRP36 [Armillaria ostoyae]|uniref:rRNA biogenesis protein RRP36 n=1 Tax=Armillaria ostoyae TaxID=47428 RepID=A0A284R954_ARMOS|nr:related to rRNA biogenesis protein RRP36 [Armillaria ostoyae]